MNGAGPAPTDTGFAPLSADHLQRVCALVYRHSGMSYGESKRYYIERRVHERVSATRCPDIAAYLVLVEASTAEREQLINAFTVNETYFYREEHQLACLSNSILPEIVCNRAPGDLVRIWSLPCATGEEPYSIALWLLENWRLVDAYNIEIMGSDIDTRALELAADGTYGERALARLPPDVLHGYFEPGPEGSQRIIQDLRESVRLSQVNLVDPASTARQGRFDVIFCRNLLIYFDDAARETAAHNLFQAINPGGFLCLGHSESMTRISDRWLVRRFPDAIVYQRPAA